MGSDQPLSTVQLPLAKGTGRGRCLGVGRGRGCSVQNGSLEDQTSKSTLWEGFSFAHSLTALAPWDLPPLFSPHPHHLPLTWGQRGEVSKAKPLSTPASLDWKPGCSDSPRPAKNQSSLRVQPTGESSLPVF